MQRRVCYDRLILKVLALMFLCCFISRYVASLLLLAAAAFAQSAASSAAPIEPAELVRKAVQNQIKTVQDDSAHFMFRGTRTTPRGSVTKIYIQTKGATAGLVIAYDGKPLSTEQRAAEEARVERFIKNPEELEKKRRQE